MRRYLKIFFGLLIPLLMLVQVSYAQVTPSPTQTPDGSPTCGFAGSAEMCCVKSKAFEEAQAGAQAGAGSIPVVGSQLNGIIGSLGDNAKKQMPDIFDKQCYYGSPVTPSPYPAGFVPPANVTPYPAGSCVCALQAVATASAQVKSLCNRFIERSMNKPNIDGPLLTQMQQELDTCIQCASRGEYMSAFGCVPYQLENFISNFILQLGIGFAGMVALLCMIYSAFILQTSAGNPERIKHAQEQMTSCITGLMLVIFSVFILRLIGVDILQLPGFDVSTPTPTP